MSFTIEKIWVNDLQWSLLLRRYLRSITPLRKTKHLYKYIEDISPVKRAMGISGWNEFYEHLSNETLIKVFHKFPNDYPTKIVVISDHRDTEILSEMQGTIYTGIVKINYVRNAIEVVVRNRYFETVDMRFCDKIVEYECSEECHKKYVKKTPKEMQSRYIVTKNKINDNDYYIVWNDEMQIRLTQPLDLSCLISFHLEFNMNMYYLIKNWRVLQNSFATEAGENDAYFYQVNKLQLEDTSLSDHFIRSESSNAIMAKLLTKYCDMLNDPNKTNPEMENELNEKSQNEVVEDFYMRINTMPRSKVPVTHLLSHDLIHYIDFF